LANTPRPACRAGASSATTLPRRQLIFIRRREKIWAVSKRAGFEDAELDLALANGDETNDRLVLPRDHHLFARERGLD
jgi:hypothetical protein